MQTERLYYDYTSAAPFAAKVLEIRSCGSAAGDSPAGASAEAEKSALAALVLDRTIFYPEGGGQGSDRGSINGIPLLEVQEKDGEVLHIVSSGDAGRLVPGPAELILDARRRRDFTVQHTAQHLLSGTILWLTGKPTVSMHLGDEINTIDVDSPELNEETLAAAEEAAADAIEEDRPVIIHFCPPEDVKSFPLRKVPPRGEEVIRVVEIGKNAHRASSAAGLVDFSPCCGTHCKSTGQIGMLRILGAEKYKGMTRVSFIAGRRVLRDSRLLRANADIVSHSLKVPLSETGRGVLALLEKTGRMERELKTLGEAAAEIRAAALLEKAGLAGAGKEGASGKGMVVIESCPNESMEEVLRIGRAAQKNTEAVLVLASEKEFKFAAFCSVKGFDLCPLIKGPFDRAGGRGGGGPSFFQGLFNSAEDLSAFLATVKAAAGDGAGPAGAGAADKDRAGCGTDGKGKGQ